MATVNKALELLDYFSEERPAIGLSEFRKLTGRDKATTYRHLCQLLEAGFLEQDRATKAYRLGHALARLAEVRRATVPAELMVSDLVDRISAATQELCHLTRLTGLTLQTVYFAVPPRDIQVAFDPRYLPPMLATSSGKAILAFAPMDFVARVEADHRTRFPDVPVPKDVIEVIRGVASSGLATTRDTHTAGVSSVAIPTFGSDGAVNGACSISYPTARGGQEAEARCAAALARHGVALSERQGGRVPPALTRQWEGLAFQTQLDLSPL